MTLRQFQDLQDATAARIGVSRNEMTCTLHPRTLDEMFGGEVRAVEDGFVGELFGSRCFMSDAVPPGGLLVRPDPTRLPPMGLGADRMTMEGFPLRGEGD